MPFFVGNKLYHSGYSNQGGRSSEIFKDYSVKATITCDFNKVYAFSTEGNIFYYSTQNSQDIHFCPSGRKQQIKDLKCGDRYSAVLFDDGLVCLLNVGTKSPLIPLQIQSPVVQVACGKEHILFLSESGQLFSYGCGSRGQLGHGTIENQEVPLLLEALDGIHIKSISCGGWHSAAISDIGDLYMWGWNEAGQLGFPCAELHSNTLSLNEIETVCCLPKVVEFEKELRVGSVSCGSRHTVVLTEDFEVWSWGWNEYGQLGHGKYNICDKPTKISFLNKFIPKSIKCACWCTLISGSLSV